MSIVKQHKSSKKESNAFYAKLDAKGRLVIPAQMRKALDFKEGDAFAISVGEDRVPHMRNIRHELESLKGILKHPNGKKGIVKEFLADRRQDAANE